MVSIDGGLSYTTLRNVSAGTAADNFNGPGDLGTLVPARPENVGAAAAATGRFDVLVQCSVHGSGLAALSTMCKQTWVDSATAGLSMVANTTVRFTGLPATFTAVSTPSQTIVRLGAERNHTLLLAVYGFATDGPAICSGGSQRCFTTAFFGSADDGLSWSFASRLEATPAMVAPADRHGRSTAAATGPSQASMAVLGDGRVLAVFSIIGDGLGAGSAAISGFLPGGNDGITLWKAYSADGGKSWSPASSVTGCPGMRHDVKGVWPHLLVLSNGALVLSSGKSELAWWVSSVTKNGTMTGSCWNYAGFGSGTTPYGRGIGTSGYTGLAEIEPNTILLTYDQLPVGQPGAVPGNQTVYSTRTNVTLKRDRDGEPRIAWHYA
jgi:hypothetical protein